MVVKKTLQIQRLHCLKQICALCNGVWHSGKYVGFAYVSAVNYAVLLRSQSKSPGKSSAADAAAAVEVPATNKGAYYGV